jgi:anti-sigma factor RsiW
MTTDLPAGIHVPCTQILESITDYLEGALPADEVQRIDEHLSACDGCRVVLEQWHEVVDLAGAVTTDELGTLDRSTRQRLLSAFRARPAAGP